MSYREVMGMPVRAFWTMSSQINRLRAEERLGDMELYLLANMNSGAEAATTLRNTWRETMGQPLEVREIVSIKEHREGISQLRALRDEAERRKQS